MNYEFLSFTTEWLDCKIFCFICFALLITFFYFIKNQLVRPERLNVFVLHVCSAFCEAVK